MSSSLIPFIILDSVDSTNNYAMGKVHSGDAIHGMACFALDQTAGKGRRGKIWETEKDKNIILSIIVNTGFLPIYHQFYLSAAVALGCTDFLNKHVVNSSKIKWPNDLYINDRKAGGILIENVIKGNLWQWAVIGIGININQTSFLNDATKRISLKNITGDNYNPIELAKLLQTIVMERIDKLKKESFQNLINEYNRLLFKLDERIKLKRENIVFETILKGVSPEGELITFDAIERRFKLDEIEWIL